MSKNLGQKITEWLFPEGKTKSVLMKDIILGIFFFLLGIFFIGSSFFLLLLIMPFLAIFLFILLGEITGVPLFEWHVVTLTFKNQNEIKNMYSNNERKFVDDLNNLLSNQGYEKFSVKIGFFQDKNEVFLASSSTSVLNFLISSYFSKLKCEITTKTFSHFQSSFSNIQSYLKFMRFKNNGWFPTFDSGYPEYWSFTTYETDIISDNKKIKETFEKISNHIESLKFFKIVGKTNQNKTSIIKYTLTGKKMFDSNLELKNFKTEISLKVAYFEKGGIRKDFDNDALSTKNVELLGAIEQKLFEVLRQLKAEQIDTVFNKSTLAFYKGKYDQNEILAISGFKQKILKIKK